MSVQPPQTTQVEPRIVNKGAFRVAGLRYAGTNEHGEIPAMWDVFFPRIKELIDTSQPYTCYGMCRELVGVPVHEGYEYLAGVEVPSLENLPAGMVGWETPALIYAVLPANDVPGIGPTCDYFYSQWIGQSKEYAMGEGIMFEEYPPSYPEDPTINIYFPVRRK